MKSDVKVMLFLDGTHNNTCSHSTCGSSFWLLLDLVLFFCWGSVARYKENAGNGIVCCSCGGSLSQMDIILFELREGGRVGMKANGPLRETWDLVTERV